MYAIRSYYEMDVVDFRRRKAMQLKIRVLLVQCGKQLLIPLDVEVRMQSTLHQHSGTAKFDGFIDPAADLVDLV